MLPACIVTSTRELSGFDSSNSIVPAEVVEAAAHFAEQVAHLESDFRVAAVDLEGADGGGGLRGHVVSFGRPEGRHYGLKA